MLKRKKDVVDLEEKLDRIKQTLDNFTEDDFNEEITNHWEILKENAARETLKSMPVDTISTLEKGMQINALMSEGLETVYDVHDKSIGELMNINGVGVISAEAISGAASKISASVYEHASPRINPDRLSAQDVNLLASIYKKWQLIGKAESLKAEVGSFYNNLAPEIAIAKARRNFLGSLFQSKSKKEKIEKAFEKLNEEKHHEQLEQIDNRFTEITVFSADRDELTRHFVQKNASYYTEIEKLTSFTQSKTAKNLPDEIAALVNEYPLELTGLKLDLRGYQAFGAKYGLHYKRTLLGDEMGLGKRFRPWQ